MFVYRITDIKNKKYYYGSKIAKNSDFNQMGKTYFSSSKNKEFIIDQKENPENFKYKLVKYFKTAEDTIKYESKLHFKFNVKSNIINFIICQIKQPMVLNSLMVK